MAGQRRRILENQYEEASHETLQEVAQRYGARVFAKVRIADALQIDGSGLPDNEYAYALIAHVDFVVAYKDSVPAFIVEFDGPRHDTDPGVIHRDALKVAICDHFHLPLLRIDDGFMRRIGRFSLLSYLVEVWFLSEAFYEAQERGEVPHREIFDPTLTLIDALEREAARLRKVSDPNHYMRELDKRLFPFDLGREAKRAIFSQMRCGVLRDLRSDYFLFGTDPRGYAIGLTVFEADEALIIGVGRCRLYRFGPPSLHELAHDLAWISAAEKLRLWKAGKLTLESEDALVALKQRLEPWGTYK